MLCTITSILGIGIMITALTAAGPLMIKARKRNSENHLLSQISVIIMITNSIIFLGMIFGDTNPAYGIASGLLTMGLAMKYAREYNRRPIRSRNRNYSL